MRSFHFDGYRKLVGYIVTWGRGDTWLVGTITMANTFEHIVMDVSKIIRERFRQLNLNHSILRNRENFSYCGWRWVPERWLGCNSFCLTARMRLNPDRKARPTRSQTDAGCNCRWQAAKPVSLASPALRSGQRNNKLLGDFEQKLRKFSSVEASSRMRVQFT